MQKTILYCDMPTEEITYYSLITLLKKANREDMELIYEFSKNLIDDNKKF